MSQVTPTWSALKLPKWDKFQLSFVFISISGSVYWKMLEKVECIGTRPNFYRPLLCDLVSLNYQASSLLIYGSI